MATHIHTRARARTRAHTRVRAQNISITSECMIRNVKARLKHEHPVWLSWALGQGRAGLDRATELNWFEGLLELTNILPFIKV